MYPRYLIFFIFNGKTILLLFFLKYIKIFKENLLVFSLFQNTY